MSIAPDKSHVTLEELLSSEDAGRFEIVNDRLEEVHVSNLSADVGAQLLILLGTFVKNASLGRVFGAECYYQCFGKKKRNARKPDVSFIAAERLPHDWLSHPYFKIAPDLVAEVVSPNDIAFEVDRKTGEYLDAGVKLVWVINPEERIVLVHRLDGTVQKLRDSDTLSGENVISGFECRVGDFLP